MLILCLGSARRADTPLVLVATAYQRPRPVWVAPNFIHAFGSVAQRRSLRA